jgi:hypothetical protein
MLSVLQDVLPMIQFPVVSNGAATLIVIGISLLCAVYCWCVVRPVRLSTNSVWPSVMLSLPVWVAFLLMPRVFDGQHTQAVGTLFTSAIVTWWASFKLLSFCLGAGPLHALVAPDAHKTGKQLPQGPGPFIATLLLPIVLLPKSAPSSAASTSASAEAESTSASSNAGGEQASTLLLLGMTLVKILVLLVLVFIIDRTSYEPLHHVCYFGCMYMGASLMVPTHYLHLPLCLSYSLVWRVLCGDGADGRYCRSAAGAVRRAREQALR